MAPILKNSEFVGKIENPPNCNETRDKTETWYSYKSKEQGQIREDFQEAAFCNDGLS